MLRIKYNYHKENIVQLIDKEKQNLHNIKLTT